MSLHWLIFCFLVLCYYLYSLSVCPMDKVYTTLKKFCGLLSKISLESIRNNHCIGLWWLCCYGDCYCGDIVAMVVLLLWWLCCYGDFVAMMTLLLWWLCCYDNIVAMVTLFLWWLCCYGNFVAMMTLLLWWHCCYDDIVAMVTLLL